MSRRRSGRSPGAGRLALFAVLTPLLVLGLLEGALRLAGAPGLPDRTATWFGDHILRPPLLRERNDPSRGLRWWAPAQAHQPHPFVTRPPPGVLRVAALGGSAVHGYGFGEAGAWPNKLELVLRQAAPELDVEVVNLGTVAWSSQQLLWASERLWDYGDWDLIVVYSGHNELLELASWKTYLRPGEHARYRSALRWRMRLQPLRLLGLLQRARDALSRPPPADEDAPEAALDPNLQPGADPVPAMTLDDRRAVPPVERAHMGSADWDYAAATWLHNMDRLLARARGHDTPVIFVNPAPNDLHDPNSFPWPGEDGAAFAALVARAESTPGGDPIRARLLREALEIEPDPLAWFRLGMELLGTEPGAAVEALTEARARAEYPNRVHPRVSRAVLSMEGRAGVLAVLDTEARFRAEHPDGLIDYKLVYDHCHPSLEGAWVVAGQVAEALLRSPLGGGEGAERVAEVVARERAALRGRDHGDLRLQRWELAPWRDGALQPFADFQNDRAARRASIEEQASSGQAEDLVRVGNARYADSEVGGALDAWEQAWRRDPQLCVAAANSAQALALLGAVEPARAWLDRARGCGSPRQELVWVERRLQISGGR